MYKFMLEMDRRLDDKFREAREQNKEDFNNTLKAEVMPLLREMSNRLAQGDKRFDDHSDRIDKATSSKGSDAQTALTKKGGWIPVDKLPAIIAGIMSALVAGAVSIIFALKSQPTPTPAATNQPTVTQPGTPP